MKAFNFTGNLVVQFAAGSLQDFAKTIQRGLSGVPVARPITDRHKESDGGVATASKEK